MTYVWTGSPQMTLRFFLTTLLRIRSKSDPKGVKLDSNTISPQWSFEAGYLCLSCALQQTLFGPFNFSWESSFARDNFFLNQNFFRTTFKLATFIELCPCSPRVFHTTQWVDLRFSTVDRDIDRLSPALKNLQAKVIALLNKYVI